MQEISKALRKALNQHAGRAWEAEMKAALGELAAKFDEWRAGSLSSSDLDAEIHAYHNGIAREIWGRFSGGNRRMALAYSVAAGFIEEQSLPPELREHIASLVEFFRQQEQST